MVERVNGRNGKFYRAKALTVAQKIALLTTVHYLRHAERMSIRQIASTVEQQNGEKLSVGAVHRYLGMQSYGLWHCGVCQVEES